MVQLSDSALAEHIARVPELYEHTDKSTARLLREVGFPDARHVLCVDDVETVLRREPHLADLWLKRAGDQRMMGGWGIEAERGDYRVQHFAGDECLHLHDRCRACAEFAVRYVGFIGDMLARIR